MNQPASTNTQAPSLAGNLQGRTILLIGGTSGIGLAAARQAKAAGASVIVVGFDPAGAPRT